MLYARRLIREGKAKSARDSEIPIELGLSDSDAFPYHGVINFVDNQIDPKTGTLLVRGVFPNKERILSPGLMARVRVPIGEPHDALLVTERAIDTDQGQKILYVVNAKNEVMSRPIRSGRASFGAARDRKRHQRRRPSDRQRFAAGAAGRSCRPEDGRDARRRVRPEPGRNAEGGDPADRVDRRPTTAFDQVSMALRDD